MSSRDRVLELLTDPRIEPGLYLATILLLLTLVGAAYALLGL